MLEKNTSEQAIDTRKDTLTSPNQILSLGNVSDYDSVKVSITGNFSGSAFLEVAEFENSGFTEENEITAEGVTTLVLEVDVDNYSRIRLSSDFKAVGVVQIEFALKKKNSITVIDSVDNIPTYNIGCIDALTPELEAQGGSSMVSLCWSNTKNVYIPTSRIIFYRADVQHLFTAGELGYEVTVSTFTIPNNLVHSGFYMKGLVIAGSQTTELNTRFKRSSTTLIKDTRASSSKQAYDIYSKSQLDENRSMWNSLNAVGTAGSFYNSGAYPMTGISNCSITCQVTAEFQVQYKSLEISIAY